MVPESAAASNFAGRKEIEASGCAVSLVTASQWNRRVTVQRPPRLHGRFLMLRLHVKIPNKLGWYVQRNPLVWALPLQALLLFWNLDLLDPWRDEWITLNIVSKPFSQIVSTVAGIDHPLFYYMLLHSWMQLPWTMSPLVSMRAMSAAWTLVATLVIYMLWVRREEPRFRQMFLALWVLSPCLILHARMARSYSMQLTLASLAIYAALQWVEQPQNRKRLFIYVGSSTALLYTHYLPGLAVTAAVCVTFLLRKRLTLAVAPVALLAILYAPWVPMLGSSLNLWIGGRSTYEGGSVISDQIVRLSYLFVSFSFGETFPTVILLLSVAMTPFVIYALWRAVRPPPAWSTIVLVATGIAWLGVSRYNQFVFMPSHLLFVLPFFLMLIARKINPSVCAALLVLYAGAGYAYFTRSGFLVKPYAAPYKEMAEVIRGGSRGQNAILAVSPYGAFSEPLLNRLGSSVRVIILNDQDSAFEVLDAARTEQSIQSKIWVWRQSRDVSPASFVSKLEKDLNVSHETWHHEFVAYSTLERWAHRLLRGPGQPKYYYLLTEFR